MNYLFTSESVSAGHPDKVADQISDAILDAYLEQDPNAKVACETLCTTDMVVVAGEVKSSATVDVSALVRRTITAIGYTDPTTGFDATTCQVANLLHEQSSDIRQGVERPIIVSQNAFRQGLASCEQGSLHGANDRSEQLGVTPSESILDAMGAGDQGIMFGYATNETSQLIPATLYLSHLILQELDAIRREGEIMTYLKPDAKSQVTIEYNEFGKPLRIDTIVVSTQHDESVSVYDILSDVVAHLIPKVIERCPDLADLFQDDYRLLVNPTGRFVIGGPDGDTGLTGRKIIVDTYGGRAAHGGGAFSGKDSSKVDRSGAYMARYIAKNLVAAGVADECQVQIAYAIGVAEPVSVMVNTFDTNHTELTDSEIAHIVEELFDLRPAAIVERFGLRKPIYSPTASYGHFGREPYIKDDKLHFGWERLDMVEELKQLLTISS